MYKKIKKVGGNMQSVMEALYKFKKPSLEIVCINLIIFFCVIFHDFSSIYIIHPRYVQCNLFRNNREEELGIIFVLGFKYLDYVISKTIRNF